MLQTKRAFRGLSGTYNIANERGTPRNIECLVEFPDNTQHVFTLDRGSKGQVLLNAVFQYLNLIQDDFFALKILQTENNKPEQLSRSNQLIDQLKVCTTIASNNNNVDNILKYNSISPRLASSTTTTDTAQANLTPTHQSNNNGNTLINHSQSSNTSSSSSHTTFEAKEESYQSIPSHINNNDNNINDNNTTISNHDLNKSEQQSFSYRSKTANNADHLSHPSCWLDPDKTIIKQYKCGNLPYKFVFCVRFYISDISKLNDNVTRNLLYLQLRNNILQCPSTVPPNYKEILASLILQADLGDYNIDQSKDEIVENVKSLTFNDNEVNERVIELYKQHKSIDSFEAKYRFLDIVSKKLDCYGVRFYDAKDFNKITIQIGVSSNGIVVFKHQKKIYSYSWASIVKIMFKRKIFSILLRKEFESSDDLIEYNLITNISCKSFWQECVTQHSFFRLQQPKNTPKKFFSFFNFGSKFQYNGKTEYQTIGENCKRSLSHFTRSPSKRYARRTIPIGWSSWNSNSQANRDSSRSSIDSYDKTIHIVNDHGSVAKDQSGIDTNQPNSQIMDSLLFIDGTKTDSLDAPGATNGCTSKTNCSDQSKQSDLLRSESTRVANSLGRNLFLGKKFRATTRSQLSRFPDFLIEKFLKPKTRKVSKAKYENIVENLTDMDETELDEFCVRTIKLLPGKDGKYGFKIKNFQPKNASGGKSTDGSLVFIIVHDVSPNSPAATCDPRLYEGDQIVSVNGQSIEGMKECDIEGLIRDIQQQDPPDLVLKVHSCVIDDCTSDKLANNKRNGDSKISSPSKDSSLDLHASIQRIKKGLVSRNLIDDFEQLSRKKDDESMEESRLAENIDKNRYRDILPYDSTRVVLLDSMTGDYINASYVNMKVPSGKVNRFIATQGPLASTCEDFWQMIWEQNSSLIIMVTPLIEAGRVKCHKYWPDDKEHCRYGQIVVRNIKEKSKPATIERSFVLSDIKVS